MIDPIENLEKEMDMIFENAKLKAINRIKKPGNTAAPWIDFSTDHLINRLEEEYFEWQESGNSKELIDIINMAVFVKLSMFYDSVLGLSGPGNELKHSV